MDVVAATIDAFRDRTDGRTGRADDTTLLDGLIGSLPDPRVHPFLIEVAVDPAAEEHVRCAALKVFSWSPVPDRGVEERVVAAALTLGRDARTPALVRQYAIAALGRYADRADVEDGLTPMLRDAWEHGGVRSAAFQTLSARRGREELFRPLRDDPVLAEEVETYLSLRAKGIL